MSDSFIHLKTHSEYSIVDGIVRIDSYVAQAAKQGMSTIALTDYMNLFAQVKFYKAAIEQGIKPIIGVDIIYTHDGEDFFCTLLCKDQQGYTNLTKMISQAYVNSDKQACPKVSFEDLKQKSAGLIMLAGCCRGDVGSALLQGNKKLARQRLQTWLKHFPNNFYLDIQRTQRANEESYLQRAVELALSCDVPVVATNDIHFLNHEDYEAHETRVCIADGCVLEDSRRPRHYSDQQYMKSSQEMQALFADIPEALQNSVEIAKRCTVRLRLGEAFLPNFPTPNQEPVDEYIKWQASEGLEQRLKKSEITTPEAIEPYRARLERELKVINEMGFPGYFLIVADFIAWAKSNAIPVGPGRGSGAGSLVAYVLGITDLDPLQHDLLFERFLNPERISMPDFDIDFCMEGRDRVIDYVAGRYGHAAVAQIITYGTMAAKAVVRDVGRVLGLPYGFVDKIAKLIPFELGITLAKALQQEPELARRYQQEDEVQRLIDLALKLEGITRNAGKHAGGVVIAPTQLTDFTALYCEQNSHQLVTQFDKDDVEAVGLVKFDFLGLRTLTIIDWALQTINKERISQGEAPIDITALPLDDDKTFDLLKSCSTTAIFQLESRGMKELIQRLQPDNFGDITALVALFRPGPLQSGMVDDFIDRKHGRAKVIYPHPSLAPILAPTYGVILYQEQVMQIAQVLSGYTLGGADILRRAMGKKKPEEMAKQRIVFVEGAKKNGIEEKVAEYIFDLVEKFAGYGFNKSHSAAYALLAYQTAWLKAHYPAEFMAAVLSSDMDNTDKVVSFIDDCRDLRLTVKRPNINEGFYKFTVNKAGEIVYGLGAIKGVGESLLQDLIEKRTEEGGYTNLFQFCHRADLKKLTRRGLEPLIKSGVFDDWQVTRESLLASVDKALKFSSQQHRNQALGQSDLFSNADEVGDLSDCMEYVSAPTWSDMEKLQGEKETLGLYVTGHPLDSCCEDIAAMVKVTINQLRLNGSNNSVIVAGIILGLRVIVTRLGKKMAVFTLEDTTGRIDVTLFSDVYEKSANFLETATVFLVKGTVAKDDYTGGVKLVAEAVMSLEQARQRMARQVLIYVDHSQEMDALLKELPGLIEQYNDGRCPIKIVYNTQEATAEIKLGDAWRVDPCHEFLQSLKALCGQEFVKLEYHS